MDGEMERVLPDDADDGAERRWIDDTLNRLSRSSFRAKFELSAKSAYARAKGKAMIDRHARELLRARIGAANPRLDRAPDAVARASGVYRAACHRHVLPRVHRQMAPSSPRQGAHRCRNRSLGGPGHGVDRARSHTSSRRLSSSIVLHPPRARHTVRGRCCRRRKKYEGDYNRDYFVKV